jgi:hypothetical protein
MHLRIILGHVDQHLADDAVLDRGAYLPGVCSHRGRAP